MSNRSPDILLADMLEAIERIESFTVGMDGHAFEQDRKTIDAVVRNCEVLGEAASRLPEDFRKSHAEVPWHQAIGLRHRIVHEYFGVDLEIIWQIVQHDLPVLKARLVQILQKFA